MILPLHDFKNQPLLPKIDPSKFFKRPLKEISSKMILHYIGPVHIFFSPTGTVVTNTQMCTLTVYSKHLLLSTGSVAFFKELQAFEPGPGRHENDAKNMWCPKEETRWYSAIECVLKLLHTHSDGISSSITSNLAHTKSAGMLFLSALTVNYVP